MQKLSDTLPALTYGTMQWGAGASEADAQAMFEACLETGVTHFDTAWVYTDGQSEKMLGTLVQNRREDVQIATKVGYTGGAGRNNIMAQFDTCRTRLQSDYIDILYMHRFDPETSLEATIETLVDLQENRKIHHIGVSNYAAWQVMKAQAVAKAMGTQIDVIQPMYSLVKRQAEVEILPMANDQEIAIVPYSPLGGGLLTGKYSTGGTGRLTKDHRYKARYNVQWMHETAISLANIAQELGHHPATLAVTWAKGHGCRPIISAKTMDQLAPSLAAIDLNLTLEERAKITALSRAPAPATDRLEEA